MVWLRTVPVIVSAAKANAEQRTTAKSEWRVLRRMMRIVNLVRLPPQPGEILAYPARTEWDMGYRDLRKFNKFCLLVAESALKFEITVFASEPLLEC